MARAGTSSSSKSRPQPKPQPKAPPKPSHYAEVSMAHGAGQEKIYFSDQRSLDSFIKDVTKRNLLAYPLVFNDATGSLFVIRSFLFCKVDVQP